MARYTACLAVGLLLLALSACEKPAPATRQAQNVKLLPDTPPPPPPKPEEKKVEPRKEDKPQQQQAQPKPAPAPEPQTLKSDEAPGQGAGNGPVAGAVTQDYQGGAIGSGNGGTGGGSAAERLAANTYAQAATRALNDYLLREKNLRLGDYRLAVNLWLQPDGRLQRAELVGSTGDAQTDSALREALQRFPGLGTPLPERMPLPLRLRVSNRMMG